METYALVLSYAIPGFVGLIILEAIVARSMGMQVNQGMDTISSLSSGMTNTLKAILGLSVVIVSYEWMEAYLGIFDIQSTVWLYILAFIGIDFAAYWSHRFNHVVNLFWNRHIIHHSSEEFNLACALRQSISDVVGIYFFLYIPLAILGIPPQVIAVTAPLHLFAQFWYHTRLIDRMGWLENILVTPSHHRVHHAINPEYIDKNYAAIFIVWDRWFGTFQEEKPDIPPVYGIKRPAGTWNPILINFTHLWLLIQDAWRTRSWKDKLRIWFMPTGWRPADVADQYPVEVIEDVFQQKKYQPATPRGLKIWSWIQLVINNLLLYHLLVQIGDFSFAQIVGYSTFLFLSVFAYTSLMDRHVLGFWVELGKFAFGLFWIWRAGTWFGLDGLLPFGTWMVLVYLFVSSLVAYWYTFSEKKSPQPLSAVVSTKADQP
jgi:alkylglycerol monooxygenase